MAQRFSRAEYTLRILVLDVKLKTLGVEQALQDCGFYAIISAKRCGSNGLLAAGFFDSFIVIGRPAGSCAEGRNQRQDNGHLPEDDNATHY